MFISNYQECRLSNNLFLSICAGVFLGLIVSIASGELTTSQMAGAVTFTIIFALLGAMALLKDISIVKCPTKILVGTTGFICLTALIDGFLI